MLDRRRVHTCAYAGGMITRTANAFGKLYKPVGKKILPIFKIGRIATRHFVLWTMAFRLKRVETKMIQCFEMELYQVCESSEGNRNQSDSTPWCSSVLASRKRGSLDSYLALYVHLTSLFRAFRVRLEKEKLQIEFLHISVMVFLSYTL